MASNITVDTLSKGSTTLNTDEIVDTNSSQVCKAWVNFDASTTSIRDSHNVSSLTNNSVAGDYVNFTNAMANTNYCVVGSANGSDTFNNGRFVCASSQSTGSVKVIGQHAYNSASSTQYIHIAVFSN